jgi:sulfane dehydrogenase subunit SoxC
MILAVMADAGDASGITLAELQLAARNHGMPLEMLRHDITPVGLHYLLIHYDIPEVDADAWRLEVGGLVDTPLSLSLEEIRSRESVTRPVTFECAGNGRARLEPRPISQPWLSEAVGTGRWTGVRLRDVLLQAAAGADAVEVLFTGIDRGVEGGEPQNFERSLPLADAMRDDVLLAYELNGAALPPQHGFPLRLVVPGMYGMASVKWLQRITVLDAPFLGYQQARGYRFREDEEEPGRPVLRILPRALMAPPGVPDFMTRERHVSASPMQIFGRAWSGFGAVDRVEFSADGGDEWIEAELDAPPADNAWQAWRHTWTPAATGSHELCCRARDEAGNVQPLHPRWNAGGYENNAVQRVAVVVDEG